MGRSLFACLFAALTMSAACDGGAVTEDPDMDPDMDPTPDPDPDPQPDPTGRIFTIGNQADGNRILMLARDDDGKLAEIGSFPTGGLGTDGGLGSQSSIAVSEDGAYLLAVNAGSDELSSFQIYEDHLALIDVVPTGGARPISLTQRGDRVYVVNAAGSGSVTGFSLDAGRLTPIAGATAELSSAIDPTGAAQVGLNPAGDRLVVTEKATNSIVTYAVAGDGSLGTPVVNASNGQTPFGFAFTNDGMLIVSEAFGGAAGASAATSYESDVDGNLIAVSPSVGSGQSAACWIQMAGFGSIAYATNTASSNLSAYTVDVDGTLNLFPGGGVVADLGAGNAPIDMTISSDQRFLYVLAAATDTVYGFEIADDGTLVRLPDTMSVPAASVGLAGF